MSATTAVENYARENYLLWCPACEATVFTFAGPVVDGIEHRRCEYGHTVTRSALIECAAAEAEVWFGLRI